MNDVKAPVLVESGKTREWYEWQMLKEQAKLSHASGLLPQALKTPQQVLIVMLKGKELGLPPMYALSAISVINGRPCLSGEVMVALIYRKYPDAIIDFTTPPEKAATECEVVMMRPGAKKTQVFRFTIEDAKRAGLLSKQPWQQYPQQMLRWRAVSMGARVVFPDAIMGCYLPEELGDVIDVQASPPPQPVPVPATDTHVASTAPPPVVQPSSPKADVSKTQVAGSKRGGVTDPQLRRLFAIAHERKWSRDDVGRHLFNVYGYESTKQLDDFVTYNETVNFILKNKPPAPVGSDDDIRAAGAATGHPPMMDEEAKR